MHIVTCNSDDTYTYVRVSADDGVCKNFRIRRSNGAVQIEDSDSRRGVFWRRARAELAETVRLELAESRRAERLQSALSHLRNA